MIFEADMANLNKYFYFRVAVVFLALQLVAGECEDNALGLSDNSVIINNKLLSSSEHNASTPTSNGRLNYTGGPSWCASSSDSTPYLQVDLGSVHVICAVATQGNSRADQWVKTYQIQSSEDSSAWKLYQESGQVVTFQGNYDSTTAVKRLLYEGIATRYIRVRPKTHHGGVCLRFELFGASKTACSSSAVGVAVRATVPDHRFTAVSSYDNRYRPRLARLGGPYGWGPLSDDLSLNPWLQIDLGNNYFICAIATQGHRVNDEWTKKYKLRLSNGNRDLQYYKEGGTEKEFTGNGDRLTIVTNALQQLTRGKVIELRPTSYSAWPTFRVEVYGVTQVCRSFLGMENSAIPNDRITASAGAATDGRLYNSGSAWCGTAVSTDYLQVDLGQSVTISGLATQGDPSADNWVTQYSVSYSWDGAKWHDYKEGQQNKTLFPGNTDRTKVLVNWFNSSLSAHYIRVYPESASGNPCLRMELYGCARPHVPVVGLKDEALPSTSGSVYLHCNVTGQPDPDVRWEFKGGDLTSQSSIVTRSNGAVSSLTSSKLLVAVSGIDAVLSEYTCRRTNSLTRVVDCVSPPYFCKARYSTGPYSVQTAAVATNLYVPKAPTVTVSNIKLTSADVSWTPDPTSIDPSKEKPITAFKITISVIGHPNTTDSVGAADRFYVITNLVRFATYTVRVTPVSAVGEGLAGSASFLTDFPATPTRLSVSKSFGRSVFITWAQPVSAPSGSGAVTSFKIEYRVLGEPSTARVATVPSSATSFTLTGLRLSSVYNVTVTPFSLRGAGVGLSKTFDTQARCDGVPVVINHFSSSSSLNSSTLPGSGRLNYTGGSSWCASSSDSTPYLEVDLGSVYVICAVATQGNSRADQWVKSYQVQTSEDSLSSWSDYEEGGKIKMFEGNYDRNTKVKHISYGVMQGRYIRFLPKSHHGGTCLRLALYGVTKQACSTSAVGVAVRAVVPDHRFTASSYYADTYKPELARLNGPNGWGPKSRDLSQNPWLQIDLGNSRFVCAIATQGFDGLALEWTTKYKLNISLDNSKWQVYQERGTDKEFDGNTDRTTVAKKELQEVSQGKIIELVPTARRSWPIFRVEVYGVIQACRHSLGVEDGSIANSNLIANQGTAADGRLYGASTWCATSLATDYLQVALGGVKTVTGIATQGGSDPARGVTSYSFSYSDDGGTWMEYKDSANSKMVFNHTNKEKLQVNWLPSPVPTAYIRVFPVKGRCLKLDVYGCDGVVAVPSVTMDDRQLPSFQSSVSLTCTITGQPSPEIKWEHKGNSISTTDAQSNGVITSTHTVSYANAASVLSDHVCHRVDVSTRKVTCTSVAYACRARYKGGAFAGRSAMVIVSLMVPDAVTDLTVDNVLARSVTIKWTRPHPGDMPITSYRVEYNEDANPASSKTATASTSATDRAISGLKPYTEYRFRIMAITSVGEGLWSAFITSKTGQAAPSEPQNLAINADASHPRVTLSWKVPTTPNGVIDGYTVYYKYLPDGVLSKEIADEKTLTVSVNITGGMRYRFEVSATTIEEGPKAMIEQVMRDYAPEAAPGGFSFRHVNATTYNCSWIPPPREKSHGDITKYEVRYTSQPTNRRRRSSDPVLVSTTETHALLFNLQLCRVFKIAARAWTSAGAGPWSEELTSENAALPPANVRILRTAVESVELEWTEPPLLGGEIMGYKIRYTGEKSYNKSFRHVGEQDTTSRTPTRLLVTTLVPGTNYRFEVATKAGCSQLVYSVTKPTAETDVSNPLPPEGEDGPTIPSSGTAVTITLLPVQATNGPISSYQVIVLRMENDVATLPDDYENKLYNVTKAEQLGLPFYITAEIPGKNVTAKSSFSVGDGTTRGSYLNARLREGKQYKVFYRAMTDWKGTIYPGKYKMVMQLTVKKAPLPDTETGGSDSLPIILGVVIAVIALITVVVVVLFLRRRKTRGNRKNCEGRTVPLHHLESKENGNSSLQLMGEEPMAAGPSTKKKEVSPLAAGKYKVPEDNATTGARDEASPIYSNAMDDEEHKPIPVVQFSEYMIKVKRADFARLKQEYQTFPKVKQFAWSVAEKPENKKYNRYGNIIAYDHSRVVLDGCGETDYINANYVHGWDGTPKVYIATQGPVPNSFLPFWFMVWNQRVSSIVMTTNLMENGKKKCHEYWPEDVAKYGDIEVSLRKSEVFADFTIRTFLLSKGSETRNVSQFHFTVWPDHGVPRLPSNIISLRRRVRARTPANTGPILVHCSAGVGRTGTFIVIDAMLEQAKKEKKVDIFNYLTVTRNDRIHMVQTEDQYVFIHKAVLEALTCGNTEHAAHDLRHVMRKLGTLNQSQGKTGYEMEFERLGFVCPYAAPDECESAGRQVNLSKNRSQAFAPLDISRVILSRPADGTHNDYINASFADAFRERNAFLMTQAPLPNTIEDFWQMVLQFSIGCVVMLNNLVEKSESYPQYWPKEVSKTATYGKITVTLESQEARGDVILRKLKVTDSAQTGKKSVIVQHLQHTAWPNHSVPAKLLGVLKLVTDVQTALQQCGNIEFIVHCSDGVGRSGTFCAIYSILERIKLEQVFDVFQAIKDIRVRRPSAVETWAQYKFCYEATQAYLDSFSDYANFSDC